MGVEVGNGECTNLWSDRWVGNETLGAKFKMLWRLETNKNVKVSERRVRVWMSGCGVGIGGGSLWGGKGVS